MKDQPASIHISRLLRLGWEFARDPIFVADYNSGLVVEANPAAERATGYSRIELIGKHMSLIHPEAERERIQATFRAAGTDGESEIEGYHLLRKDGRSLPISISSSRPFESGGSLLLIGIFRDVSERVEQELQLRIKSWALQAYADAALALGRAHSSAGLMQEICEAITRESIFVLAWVGFAEETAGKPVVIAGAAGPAVNYLGGLELSWSDEKPEGRGPTGIAIRNRAIKVVEDTEEEECYKPWLEKARRNGIRSSLNVPFDVEGHRLGVLVVYSSQRRAFGEVVTEAFTHLARELGHGLLALRRAEDLEAERKRHEQTQKDLTEALSAVVGAISTEFEMRDSYTAGHQSRVAALAYAIGKEMGWEEERLQALRMAAMVHDIGKISIPAEILNKATTPSMPEWKLIKGHPEMGYKVLKDIPFHWPVGETVRQHHERLDGLGYPWGLKGDAILPEARILAVADIVESMASARPYRPALGLDAALVEIESQAGTLLDAEVVRICVSFFREGRFFLPGWDTN